MTERIPYYDSEGCGAGEEYADGTCLPLKAHQLLLTFPEGGYPVFRILCPDDGCIQLDDTTSRFHGECWLMDWHDNLGEELIDGGLVEVVFNLNGESDCDMLIVWPTEVAEVRDAK